MCAPVRKWNQCFVLKYHFTIKQTRLEQFKHFFYRNSVPVIPWKQGTDETQFYPVFGPPASKGIFCRSFSTLLTGYCCLLLNGRVTLKTQDQSVSQSVSLYNVLSERNPSPEVNIVLGSAQWWQWWWHLIKQGRSGKRKNLVLNDPGVENRNKLSFWNFQYNTDSAFLPGQRTQAWYHLAGWAMLPEESLNTSS